MRTDMRPDITVMTWLTTHDTETDPTSNIGHTTINDPDAIDTNPAADPRAVHTKRARKYVKQTPGTSMHLTEGYHGVKDRCRPQEKNTLNHKD